MACGQAVGSAVKADVKGCLAIVDQVDDLFISDLGYQAAGLSSSYRVMIFSSCLWAEGKIKHPLPKMNLAEGEKIRGTTSVCRFLTETTSRVHTPE